jgi:hypothetical protein
MTNLPKQVYNHALTINKGPFKMGEPAIAISPKWSYRYSVNILKAPFGPGEKAIARKANRSYMYALNIIKGPWAPGEEAISKSAYWSLQYAKNIIKGQWLPGEDAIKENCDMTYLYIKDVLKKSWSLETKIFTKNPHHALWHLKEFGCLSVVAYDEMIKHPKYVYLMSTRPKTCLHRYDVIATSPKWSYMYVKYYGTRSDYYEPIIMTSSKYAFKYARDIIKGSWPEAKAIIALDEKINHEYGEYLLSLNLGMNAPVLHNADFDQDDIVTDVVSDTISEYPDEVNESSRLTNQQILDRLIAMEEKQDQFFKLINEKFDILAQNNDLDLKDVINSQSQILVHLKKAYRVDRIL